MTANRVLVALCAGLIALLVAGARVLAQAPAQPLSQDPHTVYEQRCGGCHNEHGADLARQKLKLAAEKVVVARTGRDLEAVLKKHHGVQLTAGEWPALAALFKLGMATGGVYQLRCARCHDTAVKLAREKLMLSDGRLVLRGSGKEVAAFLASHGETQASEMAHLLQALRFHVETAPK